MLRELHLQQVGSASHFDVEFANRLNIFTGDNGLGKSFLLDVAWWVLTGNWVDQPAYPQRHREELPKIISKIITQNGKILFHEIDTQSYFDFSEQKWQKNLPLDDVLKSVVIFVRVDGSFSVFDPARKRDNAYNFNPDTLWDGLILEGKVVCNGLIHDWVTWQNQPSKYPFQLFSKLFYN
jgi:AAA domain